MTLWSLRAPRNEEAGIFNLLLVEGRAGARNVLDGIFGRLEGFRVLKSSSGIQALRILEKEDIGVVVLDLLVPGLDGERLCREIQRRHGTRPLEILLIVGPSGLRDPGAFIDLGVGDFILDSAAPDELEMRFRAAGARWMQRTGQDALRERNAVDSLQAENLRLRRLCEELRQVNSELHRLTELDPLTNMANRRGLFRKMEVEFERAVRQGSPLSGIMMDVDNFKWINDRFGHPCGDVVLQEVGRRLRGDLRKYDYAGRYGGEEFFILLPNTRSGTALRIADRFRNNLEKTAFPCGGRQVRITISLGVAEIQPDETREEWVARADAAMYQAKQEGRNRALVARNG